MKSLSFASIVCGVIFAGCATAASVAPEATAAEETGSAKAAETAPSFPIPPGFTPKGEVSVNFSHWGRHTVNYSSGGSGPSERWSNRDIQDVNVLAGFEFNLGESRGVRGNDTIGLKMRGSGHSRDNGGWYIPFIAWNVDGSPAGAGVGKEFPHPRTTRLPFNVQGADVRVENIRDGEWHGFLAACINDADNVPTIMLWYNKGATGKMEDYVLLGISKDTGNMRRGPPLTEIAQQGGGPQILQIRMDEVPDAQIRNAFAVAVGPVGSSGSTGE